MTTDSGAARRSQSVNTMLDAALDLAAQGWAVFPCHWVGSRAKSPITVHGHHDATRDPDVIRSWWSRWSRAMIGASVPEALVVLDVDPRNGGDLAELGKLAGSIPETLTVWSGRGDGGRHLYFRRPTGPLTSTRLPAGIDLKVAGYCIVPPSIHPATGRAYRWEHRPVVPMPRRLRELLRQPGRGAATTSGRTGRGLPTSSPSRARATATAHCTGRPAAPPRKACSTRSKMSSSGLRCPLACPRSRPVARSPALAEPRSRDERPCRPRDRTGGRR